MSKLSSKLSLPRRSVAALALAVIVPVGCGPKEKIAPFNPRALQTDERQAAEGAPLRPVRPLPTTLQSPFEDEPATTTTADGATTGPTTTASTQPRIPPATGPALGSQESVLRMPLREFMQRAVANSLDVRVAGYDPAIDETRVTEAEARFDPTFFTNFQYGVDRILAPTPDNPTVDPGSGETKFSTYTVQTGVRQEMESGGRIEAKWEPRNTKRDPGFSTLAGDAPNPFWTSDLTLQITQPLLRDFGADVNRARIVINRQNQKISLLEFRNTLEKNIADLESNYWRLYQAEGEVKVAEQLLTRTIETGRILRERMPQDVSRVQMSQTTSSIENRRTILIRARSRVRDLSDQIKRLMNDPDLPVTSNLLLLCADTPLEEQIRFNEEDQINTAMENRAELGQQQLRSENAAIAARVAENNLLPQLNFVGNVGATGLGSDLNEAIEDDFDDHLEYAAGLQLEIPIGNRAARAIWKRAQLQRLQAITQYRALIEQVALDVKTAVREVNTTWEEIAGTTQAVFAAADALDAVEERERAAEQLTPEFVNRKLDLQQTLAEAQRLEVQSRATYQIALARLEQAKGTLLRYSNIVMEEEPASMIAEAKKTK